MGRMHTDVAMLHHPGTVLASMETGGMCLSQDGELVDVAEVRKDPLSVEYVDVDQGDSGYTALSDGSAEEEEEKEEEREATAEELIAGYQREQRNKYKKMRKVKRMLQEEELKMAA